MKQAYSSKPNQFGRIQRELEGPGCLAGYRSVWHTLQPKGIHVPRNTVAQLMRELDPDGCNLRRARRLKQRVYMSNGHKVRHIDGYDKLKQYGFPIHA